MTDRPSRLRSRALFYVAALLWLPAGVVATAAVRLGPSGMAAGEWPTALLMASSSLIVLVPCGLPLGLACRRLGRLGYARAAWIGGVVLGAATVVNRHSILTPNRRAKLTPLSDTAEVVPVANRGDPRGFV